MSDQTEGFSPFPEGIEPPDAATELAEQEALQAGIGSVTADVGTPVPIGRTYAYDFASRRFTPADRQPLSLRGADAIRLNVEKVLRTERGAAPVHTDEYGFEGATDLIQGQPFEAAEFAELEERIRDALLALPYILEVDSFDVDYTPGDDAVYLSFRVVAAGAAGDTVTEEFDRLPLAAA